MLKKIDLKLLSVLAKKPLATIKELSEETGVSVGTVSKKLSTLMSGGILLSVSAQLCYPALGLEPVLMFLRAKFKHLKAIEKALDLHPYTRYRIRCLGAVNGMYTLFAIPNGSFPLLLELLDELIKRRILVDYRYHIPIARWSYSEHDFNLYDVETGAWKFSWGDWEEDLRSGSAPPLKMNPPSVLHQMDRRDMIILFQLTKNAREKRKIIAEHCGIPTYHLSRRLRFYRRNNVIDCYRVIVGPPVSRMFDTYMFDCECNIEVTKMFVNAFSKLPFQSTFVPSREGFFAQVSIPPLELPYFEKILEKFCETVELMWSDYTSSMRYWFFAESYANNRWLVSREDMVDNILKEIEKL